MFAQMETGTAALLMALTGLITAVCTVYAVKVLPAVTKSRGDRMAQDLQVQAAAEAAKRSAYDHVAGEFRELLERAEKESTKQGITIESQGKRIEDLFGQVRALIKDNADCLVKNERLLGRVTVLEARLETVQAAEEAAGLASRLEGIIVADQNGIIREWSPASTVLFHWTRKEAVGRGIDFLIPARYKADFRRAWDTVITTGHQVRRGPFRFEARTKEDGTVPVEIILSGWEERGQRFFSASIRQTIEYPDDSVPLGQLAVSPEAASRVIQRVADAAGITAPTTTLPATPTSPPTLAPAPKQPDPSER
jgi:PAS domain S-box-containing protein